MKRTIAALMILLAAACAYQPPLCHNAGEDYTGIDACR